MVFSFFSREVGGGLGVVPRDVLVRGGKICRSFPLFPIRDIDIRFSQVDDAGDRCLWCCSSIQGNESGLEIETYKKMRAFLAWGEILVVACFACDLNVRITVRREHCQPYNNSHMTMHTYLYFDGKGPSHEKIDRRKIRQSSDAGGIIFILLPLSTDTPFRVEAPKPCFDSRFLSLSM